MKKIAIISEVTSRMSQAIRKDLIKVFGKEIEINLYILENLEADTVLEEDLFLVPRKPVVFKLQKHIGENSEIVVMSRTIPEEEIYKIYSIPKGMDVLVVNDKNETTMQIYNLLYNFGIDHVNLIPYEAGKDYKNVKVAITPDEEGYVPKQIETVINIGQRCLDSSNMIEIADKIGAHSRENRRNIIKYSEDIINIDGGIRKNYKDLYVKSEELESIINLSKEGIIVSDMEGTITTCNRAFKDIFQTGRDMVGESLYGLDFIDFESYVEKDSVKDEIIRYRDKYLNLNKINIKNMGEDTGYYFNIQEITYIKKLEQNLSKKLKETGQIARYRFEDMITKSSNMKSCIEMAKKIAKSDLTVIIRGESGTGKEVMAQSIHNQSDRKNQPFVAINCAAIPENLLESELFGYEEGTFTGALRGGKPGIFEQSHNGTLFLDEIGDMPLHLQAKLLRVLQEKQVSRIGSLKVIEIDVRIIVATHRNIDEMVKNGLFRSDLYYRLNVLPINIPPLRKRKEDIELILRGEFKARNREFIISESVRRKLVNYSWPGNVRELMNCASYICLMNKDKNLRAENLPFYIGKKESEELEEVSEIKKRMNVSRVSSIMKIIKRCEKMGISSGRSQIRVFLEDEDIIMSEGEIRTVLESLKKLELIESFSGRRGSRLTKKGEEVLNRLNEI